MANNRKEKVYDSILGQKCSRRKALEIIALSGAGVALAGTGLLQSCKPATGKAKTPPAAGQKQGTVTTRRWESTGDTVSLLGLGCMRLPSASEGGMRGGPLDQDAVNEMVDYSLSHGINYFDTAPAYGTSEIAMGIALSRHPRESYLLATKLSNFSFGGGGTPSLEAAKTMFETSLSRLKTDYVDYMLLHSLNNEEEYRSRFVDNGVLDYLIEQKAQGHIRHLGFSYHGNNEYLPKLLDEPYDWEFVQIQMNYLDWQDMPLGGPGSGKADSETLYNILTERNIPVVIMEPIRGGALANVNDGLRNMMAESHPELSPAGMALTFAGSYPNVMTVLSGMSNMEQLVENTNTFTDFQQFDDSDKQMMMEVARLYRENPSVGCTGCSYCMPCPYGIDIPGNFKLYDTCSSELNLPDPTGEHNGEYKRKRRIFLNRYNNNLAERERAEFCISCRQCVSKCPQRINIPSQLRTIENLVTELKKG